MGFFDLAPIIDNILTLRANISGLKLSVGYPPRIETNKLFLPVEIAGMRTLTAYHTELISMALIGNDTRVTENLVKTGLTFGYFKTNYHRTQFRIKRAKNGTYSIVMRLLEMTNIAGNISQDRSSTLDETIIQKSFDWTSKHLLICVNEPSLRQIAENVCDSTKLTKVTVPDNAVQVIEGMQQDFTQTDSTGDIILVDPQFDTEHQGGKAVIRNVRSFSPQLRRRVYLVLISPHASTQDTYLAFMNSVNLTINSRDIGSFPTIVEKSVKDYNHLYRSYFEAGGDAYF